MNDILINFVSGRNRPIERNRQLLGVECGGYGMMDMNMMNTCIKSIWIRRIKDMEREGLDYIGAIVLSMGGSSYDQIGGRVNVRRGGEIVVDLLARWFEYKKAYYSTGNNILEAHIFENKGITDGSDTIDNMVFTPVRYQAIRENLRELIFKTVLDGQCRVRSKREVELLFEVEITWVEYFRLRTNIQRCVDMRMENGVTGKNINVMMSRGN
jgi:hypothetical protein